MEKPISTKAEAPLPVSEEVNPPFEHFASEYRCCCGSVHVRQGAQIIAVLQLVLAVFATVALMASSEFDPLWGTLQLISLAVELGVLGLLFLALRSENGKLLLPYLIYEVLWILISIVVMGFGLYAFVNPRSKAGHVIRGQLIDVSTLENTAEGRAEDTVVQVSALFTIISFLISMSLSIWWLLVVYQCYVYFRDLARMRETNEYNMRYDPQTELP